MVVITITGGREYFIDLAKLISLSAIFVTDRIRFPMN